MLPSPYDNVVGLSILQKSDSTQVRTLFRLNMISTLFSSLNTNVTSNDSDNQVAKLPTENNVQPVLMIMQKTMPILKDVGLVWINEHSVIEVY